MATISIADNDARIQYTQAVTANVTTLTIDFPFFDLDDINVIVTTSAGVDATLTRGTGTDTFAVTGVAVDDGYSGGSLTIGNSYSSTHTYTIWRDITAARTTDFATSGPFNIASLNTDLDKIYAIIQQIETENNRALTLPNSDATASIVLPTKASRLGKYLAFNSSTGLAEVGGSVADTGTVAAQAANIATLAGIHGNITTVAGIHANVTTVAGVASNVTTVAGISSDVTAVAADATDIGAVAGKATEIGRLGTSDAVADMATLGASGVVGKITTVADNVSDVTTVADNIGTISAKAPLASPALTGNPTAPTQSASDNSTKIATTAYVDNQVATENTIDEMDDTTITSVGDNEILQYNNSASKWENQTLAEAGIATLASPTFTGTPAGPTASTSTNTTQLATTAFVQTEIAEKAAKGFATAMAIAL